MPTSATPPFGLAVANPKLLHRPHRRCPHPFAASHHLRFLRMGHGNVEKSMLKPRDENLLLDSDDERPKSFGDEFRRKEMRRGTDLATTQKSSIKKKKKKLEMNKALLTDPHFKEMFEIKCVEIQLGLASECEKGTLSVKRRLACELVTYYCRLTIICQDAT